MIVSINPRAMQHYKLLLLQYKLLVDLGDGRLRDGDGSGQEGKALFFF